MKKTKRKVTLTDKDIPSQKARNVKAGAGAAAGILWAAFSNNAVDPTSPNVVYVGGSRRY